MALKHIAVFNSLKLETLLHFADWNAIMELRCGRLPDDLAAGLFVI